MFGRIKSMFFLNIKIWNIIKIEKYKKGEKI